MRMVILLHSVFDEGECRMADQHRVGRLKTEMPCKSIAAVETIVPKDFHPSVSQLRVFHRNCSTKVRQNTIIIGRPMLTVVTPPSD